MDVTLEPLTVGARRGHAGLALYLPDGFVPCPIRAHATGSGLAYDVDYVVDFEDPGAYRPRVVCTELVLRRRPGGAAITSTGLRLSVSELVDRAVALAITPYQVPGEEDDLAIHRSRRASYVDAIQPRKPTRTPEIRDDQLEQVAIIARASPRAKTSAVEGAFQVSRSTAHRAIKRAEAAGFPTEEDSE